MLKTSHLACLLSAITTVSRRLYLFPILVVALGSMLAVPTYPQTTTGLGVNAIMRDVKRQFRLTSNEMKNIRPMITQENRKVLEIYARFSGDELEYSHRLWREMITQRQDFESGIQPSMANRQKLALRAARTAMERQMLKYLVEEFVDLLGQVLDLRDWEFDAAFEIFRSESDNKLRVLVNRLSEPGEIDSRMQRLTKESDERMRRLLSQDQWRAYRALLETPELIG